MKNTSNCLPSITTCTGDSGTSSLAFGPRISKSDEIFELIGNLDELNSSLGICACYCVPDIAAKLQIIQKMIFSISGCIACNQKASNTLCEFINDLNRWETEYDKEVPEFESFILPGGHVSSAYLHLARTICRRAERSEVRCYLDKEDGKLFCQILKRLSDVLFIFARYQNIKNNVQDILYK